jgi:hypothetical protein
MLKPVEPTLKDGCSYDVEEAVFKLVVSVIDGQQLTKRMLADTYHLDWKKEHPELSRTKLESALTGFVTKGRLFEIKAQNKMGKTVWILSTEKTPDDTGQGEKTPDKTPDKKTPDIPDNTGQAAVRYNNVLELQDISIPDKITPDGSLSGNVSARNHNTVIPDKTPPYGGTYSRPVFTERDNSPMPIGNKKAVQDGKEREHTRIPEIEPVDLTDAVYEFEDQEDENAIYI